MRSICHWSYPSLGISFCAAALCLVAGSALAQNPVRLYLAPDDHTDYFWAADDVTYRQAFGDMLDYYLDLADATINNPPDSQSRWSCDGWFWLKEYAATRSPAQFERLMSRIRSGHINAPLNALALNEGASSAEAVIRGMYYPGTLEREYNLRFRLAYNMENQTHPLGLFPIWAGSGAMYSWKGVCNCGTVTPASGDREHDIYWARGFDGSRILMKWNSLLNGNGPNDSIGGYAEARFPAQVIDILTSNAPFNGFAARYPYGVIGAFGRGWDDVATFTNEFVTLAQTASNASRRVIVSNQIDFFQDFAAVHGSSIPQETRSYGNEWDLACATLAAPTARYRAALQTLRTAEALAAIASIDDPTFMTTHAQRRNAAQDAMGLYFEHDFSFIGPAGTDAFNRRITWMRGLVDAIDTYPRLLLSDGLNRLSQSLPAASSPTVTNIAVFNPLSWSRTDAAQLPWPSTAPVHVVDLTTNLEVPSERDTSVSPAVIRFLAADVPSVGYKSFQIRPGAGQTWTPVATVTDELDNTAPITQTVTYTISADNRDATSGFAGTGFTVRTAGYAPGDANNYISTDAEQEQAGVQFAVSLPANATIQNARLVVRTSASQSAPASGSFAIRAYDTSNCPPFVNGQAIALQSFQPLLSTTILWPAQPWVPGGSDATSTDLSPLVQQFITRPGYQPGNHLGLLITAGTTSTNAYVGFEDFAQPGGTPARLVITYTIPGSGTGAPTGRKILTSSSVAMTLDPRGAITSMKAAGQSGTPVDFASTLDGRAINDLGPAQSTSNIVVEHIGPVTATLRATAASPVAHTSRITLLRSSDRLAIQNQITQSFADVQSYCFPFAIQQPDILHEEIGSILRARLTTDGGHYSPRNARYEWLTLNHFALMTGQATGANGDPFAASILLSNQDASFLKIGRSTLTTLDTASPAMTVLVGGDVMRIDPQGRNQFGDTLFTSRFAVHARPGQMPQAQAMRLAMEHQHPLLATVATGPSTLTTPPTRSYLTVTNPDVIAWAFKPAQDGPTAPGGPVTLRLWNVSDGPTTAALQTQPRTISQALVSTHIETLDPTLAPAPTPSASGGVDVSFTRQQLRTIRLQLAPPLACSPADIAYGDGEPLPPFGLPDGFNPGVDGGDFDCFFNFYFEPAPLNAVCDIAYGDGEPLPPYGAGGGFNPGVDGGDFDCFFNFYFNGCL